MGRVSMLEDQMDRFIDNQNMYNLGKPLEASSPHSNDPLESEQEEIKDDSKREEEE